MHHGGYQRCLVVGCPRAAQSPTSYCAQGGDRRNMAETTDRVIDDLGTIML